MESAESYIGHVEIDAVFNEEPVEPLEEIMWTGLRQTSPVDIGLINGFSSSPLNTATNFKIASRPITFRTLHSSQRVYLLSALHARHSTRSLRSSNTNFLSIRYVRTAFDARSFSVAAPTIWDSLHLDHRMRIPAQIPSAIKTHYFQQAFQPTKCLSLALWLTIVQARLQIIFTHLLICMCICLYCAKTTELI